MQTLLDIKAQAHMALLGSRTAWLGELKKMAGEAMRATLFQDICIRFTPETRWETGTVVNGTLLLCGDWRELLGDNYAELAKVMLESDPFFEGWRVDIGVYMDMQYLVVTEISRS